MIEKISGDTAQFEAPLTAEDMADLLSDDKIRLIRPWGGYRPIWKSSMTYFAFARRSRFVRRSRDS